MVASRNPEAGVGTLRRRPFLCGRAAAIRQHRARAGLQPFAEVGHAPPTGAAEFSTTGGSAEVCATTGSGDSNRKPSNGMVDFMFNQPIGGNFVRWLQCLLATW